MNNIINNNLIHESSELTPSESLSRITANSMLEQIENINNAHIYMLRDHLTWTAFAEIEMLTLSMIDGTKPDNVNLKRLKNLLPLNLFEQRVKIYLDKILEDSLVYVNIPDIRDNAPPHLYKIFIKEYLQNEDCWKYFYEIILGMANRDILTFLSSPLPCFEKHLIFKYVSDEVSGFLDDDELHVVGLLWKTIDDPHSAYCENCIQTKNNIVKRMEIVPTSSYEFVYGYLTDSNYWCCECLNTPLLQIMNDKTHYITTEYIGKYQNIHQN